MAFSLGQWHASLYHIQRAAMPTWKWQRKSRWTKQPLQSRASQCVDSKGIRICSGISWDLFHLARLFLVLKFLSLWWPQVSYPVNNFTRDPHYSEGWKSGYFSIWPSLEVIPRTIEVSRIWRRKLSTSASRSELNYTSALNFRSMFDWLTSVWSSLLFDKLNVYQRYFFELYPLFLGSVATVWPPFLVHPWSTTRYIPQISAN